MCPVGLRNLPNIRRERTVHEPRGGVGRGVSVEAVRTIQTAAIANEQGPGYLPPVPSVPRLFRSVLIVRATFRITDRRAALYFVPVKHTPKIRNQPNTYNAPGLPVVISSANMPGRYTGAANSTAAGASGVQIRRRGPANLSAQSFRVQSVRAPTPPPHRKGHKTRRFGRFPVRVIVRDVSNRSRPVRLRNRAARGCSVRA